MAASRVRQHFADTLDLVRVTRGRIIVKNHGTAIAAIVPVEDAELLAAIEDEEDIRIADERLRAFREGKMTVIAAEELYKKLGI